MKAPFLVVALSAVVGSVAFGSAASAQVTTQPRDMGLPGAPSLRPEPSRHRVELGNGLVAYVAEDDAAPLVTVTAFVNAGYADGPDGAAEVLAQAYRARGPAGMGAETFRSVLREMTAEYRVALGAEQIEVTMDVPSEDGPAALDLLARLVLLGPALVDADLSAVVGQAGGAESRYEGSLASATQVLRGRLLRGTPYAPAPTTAALEALTLDDVRGFHRDHFVAGNMSVAVGGAWREAQVRDALQAFDRVPEGNRLSRSPVPAPPLPGGRTLHLLEADKLQGWLVLGTVLPALPERDQAALEVANYILGGGHFDTRLFVETRDKRGLTNDDSGFPEAARRGPGTYTFRTYGRPAVVRLLLDITLREIERIRSETVTEEELFVAKGALADGDFAIRYRDGWATARSLAEEWVAYGNHERSASYIQRVRAVTAEDVQRVARRYLHPEAMTVVLIGPIEAIQSSPSLEGEGPLASYGDVRPISDPELRP